MGIIGIWEGDGAIAAWLHDLLPQAAQGAHAVRSSVIPFDAAESLDILLLGAGLHVPPDAALPACRLFLLPGDLAPLATRCQTPCAMSYGLSDRDSLTLSATRGGHFALSIQRELLTLDGRPVEQQELILPKRSEQPLLQMAVALLLLALGTAPESLPALFEQAEA